VPIENWSKVDTTPLIIGGSPMISYETIIQDGGRSGDMVYGTILGQIGASRKWRPVSPAVSDGAQFPRAVLMRTLLEADIIAGDIDDVPLARGGGEAIVVDKNQIVWEGATTQDTLVNDPTNLNSTMRELLVWANIYVADTKNIEVAQEPAGP
jgi:hypothetical protein